MFALKLRVEHGKLVGDAPPDLPEGTEFFAEPISVNADAEAMTDDELARLHASIERGLQSMKDGRGIPVEQALAELRSGS